MLTGAPAQRRRDHEIGLPAKKRRNLQHVDNFRDLGHVGRFVNIGQHRHVELRL